jgi:hypothetical protein
MNIFETIRKVTSGYEQYHSQFLADALAESLSGDCSLFNEVWKITAPSDWEIPDHADITSEEVVERGRVDICMRCIAPKDRVIGIEVKTVDTSARSGQLEEYFDGLERNTRDQQYRLHTLPRSTESGPGMRRTGLVQSESLTNSMRCFPAPAM